MADLPEEGMYRIDSVNLQCVTILLGNGLHGQNVIGTNVMLQYIVREEGLCTLRVDESYLGVDAQVQNDIPVVLVNKSHRWILERNGNSFTIRYPNEPGDVQYFWRLCSVGQPVVIHDNQPIQTWEFNL